MGLKRLETLILATSDLYLSQPIKLKIDKELIDV